ncbi:MAG: amidase [Acidimicrobiia bacterium]|nr:amidase [Acidimicrobiia bacterium]
MLERFEDWWHADREARQQALVPLLERVERVDPTIRAWVCVVPQWPEADGPLSGIPFGVKDIIETAGLPTEYGSPLYKGRQGAIDADIVTRLRRLGGLLLGKTTSCPFACRTPTVTRNPRNLAHTPGGSSAGSAAAVAASMVPFALGTQTHGSVLRPASYCGVTGFKPTYGLVSNEGVLPVARTLDTLGFFTHTPEGMSLLWEALGYGVERAPSVVFGVPDPPLNVDPPMRDAFDEVVAKLLARGFAVQPAPIAPLLATMPRENRIVECYEGARVHEARFREHVDRLGDVAEMVREGLRIPAARYDAALAYIAECRETLTQQFGQTPVILTPAATGPAPAGFSSTGDARMNSPWTALGTPAITVPMPVRADALPLGLQLASACGTDGRLLATASIVSRALDTAGREAGA